MDVRAWKRVTGDAAKQLESKGSAQTAGVFAWLERELGAADFFNGASFGYGDLSVYPHVHGSVVWGNPPKAGTRLAEWLARVEERPSVRKTIEAAQQFAGSFDALAQILESGAFARQYRDHRLEWMLRSGGIDVVVEGLKKKTIRFSSEIS
jgi:Glutathione S-transferase, C-terminal domain